MILTFQYAAIDGGGKYTEIKLVPFRFSQSQVGMIFREDEGVHGPLLSCFYSKGFMHGAFGDECKFVLNKDPLCDLTFWYW